MCIENCCLLQHFISISSKLNYHVSDITTLLEIEENLTKSSSLNFLFKMLFLCCCVALLETSLNMIRQIILLLLASAELHFEFKIPSLAWL